MENLILKLHATLEKDRINILTDISNHVEANSQIKFNILEKLYVKSEIFVNSQNSSNEEIHRAEIRNYLENLYSSRNLEIMSILEIASKIEMLIIQFDFNCEFVVRMYKHGRKCHGVYLDSKSVILIGAKRERRLIEGTLIHELTHCVLTVVYNNHGLPYRCDDFEAETNYESIVKKYQIFKKFWTIQKFPHAHRRKLNDRRNDDECDGIISRVYRCNDFTTQKNELIVRVPQILAAFNGNHGKISKLKSIYADLFRFYNEKVIPDLINVIENC